MTHKKQESVSTSLLELYKENRKKTVNIVSKNKKLFDIIIINSFDTENKDSYKYARIIELICVKKSINHIIPYLDFVCKNISTLKSESSIRSYAKICELIATHYITKKEKIVQEKLTSKHINLIISTGFDWLITKQKIAVNIYTIQTLFLLGKKIKWVHPELEHMIKTKIIKQSKATEARGKKILTLIQKFKS